GAWSTSSGRAADDIGHDVHYATAAGAKATLQFSGTGIDLIGPSYPGSASATIKIDGVVQSGSFTEATAAGTGYRAQQAIYSVAGLTPGTHTLEVTNNQDGQYSWGFQVDGFRVRNEPIDNSSSQITYNGTWN